MTEELNKTGQDGADSQADDQGQGQQADGGGRPDAVWRNSREYEKMVATLEAKGYDINEFKTGLDSMPSKADLQLMQQQQQANQSSYNSGYEDGDDYLSKREAAQLVNDLMVLKKELTSIKSETKAEKLEREARETGLTPVLQKAYKALRQLDPDADPTALKSELANVVQTSIQDARKKSGTKAATGVDDQGQSQDSDAPERQEYKGNSREQMSQWAKNTRDAIVARLSSGGGLQT